MRTPTLFCFCFFGPDGGKKRSIAKRRITSVRSNRSLYPQVASIVTIDDCRIRSIKKLSRARCEFSREGKNLARTRAAAIDRRFTSCGKIAAKSGSRLAFRPVAAPATVNLIIDRINHPSRGRQSGAVALARRAEVVSGATQKKRRTGLQPRVTLHPLCANE